jgi:hypothetical protein
VVADGTIILKVCPLIVIIMVEHGRCALGVMENRIVKTGFLFLGIGIEYPCHEDKAGQPYQMFKCHLHYPSCRLLV